MSLVRPSPDTIASITNFCDWIEDDDKASFGDRIGSTVASQESLFCSKFLGV